MKLPEDVREFFRRTGRIGAERRHAGMSPERRREIARLAANARWKNVEINSSNEKQSTKSGTKAATKQSAQKKTSKGKRK